MPGGFIKFSGGVLTLHPDLIHVEVDLSISQLADAHFTGDIHADGTYELSASANLNIAGFEIPIPSAGPNLRLVNGQLDISFNYGIPGLDEFLPEGDASVTFSGTYSLDGSFSLTATAHYKFTIGPVVVNEEFITLTNTSLTLGARGTIADLGPLAEGEVSMTIYKDGTFHAVVTVDSSIAGFDLGNAEVTFGKHNPDKLLISTLHAQMSVPTMVPSNVLIDGYWDANGNYDFKGSADVILGGLTLAQAQFEVSKSDYGARPGGRFHCTRQLVSGQSADDAGRGTGQELWVDGPRSHRQGRVDDERACRRRPHDL